MGYSPWGLNESDTHVHLIVIYNAVLISSIQQSESFIHTYIYTLFSIIFPIMVYPRMLNIAACAVQ